jgi:hypothetical protein
VGRLNGRIELAIGIIIRKGLGTGTGVSLQDSHVRFIGSREPGSLPLRVISRP